MTERKLTLRLWRERVGISQAGTAAQMMLLAPQVLGHAKKITQQRVLDLERGVRPEREVLLLIYVLSHGQVDANVLYELPDWRDFKHALQALPATEPPAAPDGAGEGAA